MKKQALAALGLAVALALPVPALAKKPPPPVAAADGASAEELKAQRQQLRARLQELKKQIAKSEAHRSEAADALAHTEKAISDTNRQLRNLNVQQRDVNTRLIRLREQQQQASQTLQQQQEQLGELLRQHYRNGAPDTLRLFLSGGNPNRIQRDMQYLAYLAQAQKELLGSLQQTLVQLTALEQESKTRQSELTEIRRARETHKQQLVKETQSHRKVLTQLSSKIKAQKREAGALERDEKRLASLVEQIARVIAEQRAQQRKKHALRKEPTPARSGQPQAGSPPEAVVARNEALPDDSLPDDAFQRLKGRLRLPVRGDIVGRFGSARAGGGPSWKGLFIRAESGAEVRAIAPGRVVFAEWLRGFGNLLIIDHGGQYMSIYGNNEALFKETGDAVKAGEAIASAGNSGGNAETGLYFELRHAGQPFDPMRWVSLKN